MAVHIRKWARLVVVVAAVTQAAAVVGIVGDLVEPGTVTQATNGHYIRQSIERWSQKWCTNNRRDPPKNVVSMEIGEEAKKCC